MYCSFNLTSTATCMTGAWNISSEGVGCNPGVPAADAGDDAAADAGGGSDDGGDGGD
jgi:hypothetical protein